MDELESFLTDMTTRLNAVLAPMPPLEQFQTLQELSYPLECIRRLIAEAKAVVGGVNAQKIKELKDKILAGVKPGIVAEARTGFLASEMILKTDADAATQAAVNAAVENAKKEIRLVIEGESKMSALVAERRTKLVADKKLPGIVAEKMSDDILKGDTFEAGVGIIAERVTRLAGIGITPESEMSGILAELCALPVDDAGQAAFNARFTPMEGMFKLHSKGAPPVTPTPAVNPAGITAERVDAPGAPGEPPAQIGAHPILA